ncbi:hypothetical protein ACOMHN_043567 [Nucella lapillus]
MTTPVQTNPPPKIAVTAKTHGEVRDTEEVEDVKEVKDKERVKATEQVKDTKGPSQVLPISNRVSTDKVEMADIPPQPHVSTR